MLRKIAAVVLGVVLAFVLIIAVESLGHSVYPPPADLDLTDQAAMRAYVDTLPLGMRQGGVTTSSITLVNAGTVLTVLAPTYRANTGVATWNFNAGTPNSYTIPAGDTLRVVYQVTADADLGAGLILTNAATATLYYSFDDDAVPRHAPTYPSVSLNSIRRLRR